MKTHLNFIKSFFCCALLVYAYGLHAQIYNIPYTQTFDAFPFDNTSFAPGAEPNPLIEDWVNVGPADDAQDWYGRSTATGSSNTGPSSDHTGGGRYMFVEDGFGNHSSIQLQSPGIDLTGVTVSVILEYWAHSRTTSTSSNGLRVFASNDQTTWTQIDSFGTLSTTDTWFQRTADLTPFLGDTVYIIWEVNNDQTSFQHDIAIDDVSVFENVFSANIAGSNDITCNGGNDGYIAINTNLGTPPYSYSWSNGATTDTLHNATAGIHCVTVSDNGGQTITLCDTLTEPTAVIATTLATVPIVCAGDSNGVLVVDTAIGGMPLPPPPGSGCFVDINNNAVCSGSTDTVQVGNGTVTAGTTTYPNPYGNWYWGAKHQIIFRANELTAAGLQAGLISGLAFDIASIAGTTNYTAFRLGMACVPDSTAANWIPNVPEVMAPQNITIAAGWNWHNFDAPYMWDGTSNIVLEVCFNNSGFTNNSSTNSTTTSYTSVRWYRADISTVCSNTSSTTGTSSNRPNVRFTNCPASIPVPFPYNVSWSNGSNTVMATGLSAGTYTVTVTDASGCTDTDTLTVTEATPVNLGGDTAICQGVNFTLNAGMYSSYMWSDGSTAMTYDASAGGTISVGVTDSLGCMSSDTVVVTVNNNPVINLGVDTSICAGNLTLDPGAGYTNYNWSTGDSTQTVVADSTVAYAVVVTDTNGCMGTDTINITVNPLPTINLGPDTVVCQGGTITLDAGAGLSAYAWSTSTTAQTELVTTTGNYSVTVTDANNCENFDSIMVTISPPFTVNLGPDTAFCQGTSIVLDAGAGLAMYAWSNNVTTSTNTVNTVGNYSVTVTDINGCELSDDIVVSSNPNPTVSLGPDTAFCDNAGVLLDAGAGFSAYNWSSGSNIQTDLIFITGTYSVTVTDANGCEGSDDVVITSNPAPTVNLGSDTMICQNTSITLDAGAGFSAYNWSTGDNTQSAALLAGGTYSVTVTDANGCQATDVIQVTIDTCLSVGVLTATNNTPVLNVYPNPNQGEFNISLEAMDLDDVKIQLFDTNGRLVYFQEVGDQGSRYEATINVGALPEGMYLLRLTTSSNSASKRIIIHK